MESLIYVGLGGFLGANARYLLTIWADGLMQARWGVFPFGTLVVNLLGSIGLALFATWFAARTGLSPQLRLLVGAGFFGAFTTFSTFANESFSLWKSQGITAFLLNVVLNNGLCLAGVVLGILCGQRLFASAQSL
ncbi:MAG: fluoride efflux transporter CrcB [Chloroflexi bacterium]|nr:fluoride efflux transporter CrcB [Chloroflexota bacterium]